MVSEVRLGFEVHLFQQKQKSRSRKELEPYVQPIFSCNRPKRVWLLGVQALEVRGLELESEQLQARLEVAVEEAADLEWILFLQFLQVQEFYRSGFYLYRFYFVSSI